MVALWLRSYDSHGSQLATTSRRADLLVAIVAMTSRARHPCCRINDAREEWAIGVENAAFNRSYDGHETGRIDPMASPWYKIRVVVAIMAR
jgi:hypothetical protein